MNLIFDLSKGYMMKGSNKVRCAVPLVGMAVAMLAALLPQTQAHAHGNEARLVDVLEWKKLDHISRVFGVNRVHLEGSPSTNVKSTVRDVEGQSCAVGQLLAFDVDDKYAFDIDEPVTLKLTYAAEYTTPFVVGWDMNGGTGGGVAKVEPETGGKFRTATITLDRARFAGQGTQGSDIAIGAPNGAIVLCDMQVVRSNTTQPATEFGSVQLTIKDAKTNGNVPARVGIYDVTGRAPLASDRALMLQRFADDVRMLAVNERTYWPSDNRQAFYVDGKYDGKLPVGSYELVVTRGIEFHVYHGKFEVKKDQTSKVNIALERYADMPKAGWYSGDGHIHVTRDQVDDQAIWGFVAAEDVHVGNLLQMGNINTTYFKQPKEWGKASRFERDGHFIVSGQEDPRTGQMGHTIHYNIQRPVHLKTEDYFMYDRVFEDIKTQGGISGFAHLGWVGGGGQNGTAGEGQMIRGLALLAPFGLVNFIEVLQGGRLFDTAWYRLLNLGYHVTPDAGTDWPYSDFPGVVRHYVKLDGPLNLDAWFASFKAGHLFVTNGPLLEFTVNGRQMGEEIHVKRGTRLDIVASAQLNPDLDKLDRMELVVLGDVAATESAQGKDKVAMKTQLVADRSMWVAVRAYGGRHDPRNMTVAHTTPVYVVVDDEPTWKAEAVPTLVAELRGRVQRILTDPIDTPIAGNEPWETRLTLADQWLLQQPMLKARVDAADALYKQLLDRFNEFEAKRVSTKSATSAR